MNKEAKLGFFILIGIAIFIYLSINIGAIRLWANNYNTYYTYFDDICGLEQKAVVKISGFTVGWIDEIRLADDKDKVMVVMRVSNNHKLYKTAYAAITQDGLLGNKILEIDPGASSAGLLAPGSVLRLPGVSKATLSDILEQAKEIANNIYSVAQSFSRVFSSQSGEEKMSQMLENAHKASDKISEASSSLLKIIDDNTTNINRSAERLSGAITDISQTTPMVKNTARELEERGTKALTSIQTASSDAAIATKDVKDIVIKIKDGEGTIGKLVCDDSLYDKAKEAVEGLGELTGKAKTMEITVDSNFRGYWRIKNSRGEVSFNIKTIEDYFYSIGLSSDDYGKVTKKIEMRTYCDKDSVPLDINLARKIYNEYRPDQTTEGTYKADNYKGFETLNGNELASVAPQVRTTSIDRNGLRWSIQIGKKFKNFTFRGGKFDDAFGIAVDFDVPLKTKNIQWKTSLQVFDFSGTTQIWSEIGRPNVRWTNKVKIFKNIYTVFGIDDMCGKHRAAPFWGLGLSFNDDDLKYLLLMAKGGF